jgi:hypothetical protein
VRPRVYRALQGDDEGLANAADDITPFCHAVLRSALGLLPVHGLGMHPAGCPAVACGRFDGGKRELQRIAKGCRCTHFTDIRAQLDKSPRHARRDPRDDAIASHQPGPLG